MPHAALIHTSDIIFIKSLQTGLFIGAKHLKVINHIHILHDAHFLSRCRRTSFIIIKEIIGQRKSFIFIQRQVTSICQPVAMNSLVMNQNTKRFVFIRLFSIQSMASSVMILVIYHVLNGVIVLRNKSGL